LNLSLTDFKSNVSPFSSPVTASLDATYEPGKGTITLKAKAEKDQTLNLLGHVQVSDDLKAWSASVDLDAKDFPIRTPVDVGPGRVKAKLDGTAHVTDFHRDARMNADLHLRGLDVGGVITDVIDIGASHD